VADKIQVFINTFIEGMGGTVWLGWVRQIAFWISCFFLLC
jgi:hypothetical protein